MSDLPTWRTLAARARQVRATIEGGDHEAAVHRATNSGRVEIARFRSWLGRRKSDVILRAAVAAALEQMEVHRG